MASFLDMLARIKSRATKDSDHPRLRKQSDGNKESSIERTRSLGAQSLQLNKTLSRTSSMSSTLVPEDEGRRSSVQSAGATKKGRVYGARDWRMYSVGSQGQ